MVVSLNTEQFQDVIDDDGHFTTGFVNDDKIAGGRQVWNSSEISALSHEHSADVSTSIASDPKIAERSSTHDSSTSVFADPRDPERHAETAFQLSEDDAQSRLIDSNRVSPENTSPIQLSRGPDLAAISAADIHNTAHTSATPLARLGNGTSPNSITASDEDKKAQVLDPKSSSSDFPSSTAFSSIPLEAAPKQIDLLREDSHPAFYDYDIPPSISKSGSNRSSTMSRNRSQTQKLKAPLLSQEFEEEEGEDDSKSHSSSELRHDAELREELPKKWILTLSMHFRDGTKRDKFFITYIQEPNHWIRISISIDYNHGEVEVAEAEEDSDTEHMPYGQVMKTTMKMRGGPGSLEDDLETMMYQRDKGFVLYKAVHQSLEDIKFFSTITNLKIETFDDRLHIHVAEDVNEKIPYPPLTQLAHLNFARYQYVQVQEHEVNFVSHLSGFVYRVNVRGRICVKKEITSIDTVPEFLYELEALARLRKSKYVINLFGVVIGELNGHTVVTGVLLEYASGGALNDFFYENQKLSLDSNTKMTWIRQVVEGLSDIHESGYVQGDCTLSNVVIDSDQNAKIVDINRRGCPIGWEPPEFRGMIASGQRISMFIGVKSDLFQLGMMLWAIWNQVEEPDREGSLELDEHDPDIPSELRSVVSICLKDDPVERLSAKDLLTILKPLHEYNRPPMKVRDITSGVTHEDIQAIQRPSNMYHRRGSRSDAGSVGAYFTQDRLDGKLQGTQIGGFMDEDTTMIEAEVGLGAFADNPKDSEEFIAKPPHEIFAQEPEYE